eukprot:gene321-biopygen669
MSSPCVFHHKERDIRVVVHGDDFTFLGPPSQMNWVAKEMATHVQMRIPGRIGHGRADTSMRLLTRVITWSQDKVTFEPDRRHAEIICRQLELHAGDKPVGSPGIATKEAMDDESPLPPAQAIRYRALTARAMYLAQDRGDIMHAAKECARFMSSPHCQGLE